MFISSSLAVRDKEIFPRALGFYKVGALCNVSHRINQFLIVNGARCLIRCARGWPRMSCFGVDWSTGKKLFALVRTVGGKVLLFECSFNHAYALLSCMNVWRFFEVAKCHFQSGSSWNAFAFLNHGVLDYQWLEECFKKNVGASQLSWAMAILVLVWDCCLFFNWKWICWFFFMNCIFYFRWCFSLLWEYILLIVRFCILYKNKKWTLCLFSVFIFGWILI